MSHASVRAAESKLLKRQEPFRFREPGFSYSLSAGVGGVRFSTTDGEGESAAAPAVWAFGAGEYGQTYILDEDGTLAESRLSYFTSTEALDITPGQSNITPHRVKEALGRKLDSKMAEDCFRCHTTVAVTSKIFKSDEAIPGVTCESCHGPGAQHVSAMRNGDYEQAVGTIVNPRRLSAPDSVDFCGACHRTWADVTMEGGGSMGAAQVRFQPYRLEMSRCWGEAGDARITCVACHDPHQPLVRELSSYDTKCLACHGTTPGSVKHNSAKTCEVGNSDCASCHMPKVKVPQARTTFTDHYIRVVRGSESDNRKSLH
jgi:hypothetical protein